MKVREQEPLVIDCFAGGGGASMGIEQALGRAVDVAINHDPEAVAMHAANHPHTKHYTQDIWAVDPLEVVAGKPVALAWFSPDCTHFSKAKGGKPREKRSRDLAWVVVEWAAKVRPAVIMLENVEEFRTWGPLDDEGQPIKAQAGETWREWLEQLRGLGYDVEWRELRASDYGAPTIRRRLFIIARCDGEPIRWPAPTHGRGMGLLPYRTAAECIDWDIPCPSIFERARPLADATLRRIAHGVWRFVINNPDPFIIHLTHHGRERTHPVSEPLPTVTAAHRGEQALVTPFLARTAYKEANGSYVNDAREPFHTITAQQDGYSVVTPFLTKFQQNSVGQELDEPVDTVMAGAPRFGLVAPTLVVSGYSERDGQAPRAPGLDKPLGTVVAGGGKHALVAAFLAKHFTGVVGAPATAPLPTILSKAAQTQLVAATIVRNNHDGQGKDADGIDEPLRTVTTQTNKHGLVTGFLQAYYGSDPDGQAVDVPVRTLTTKERFALVMVHGQPYYIDDIGMRMLTPRELYRAQGFPEGYIIAPEVNGKPLSKTAQIRCCGNAVVPQVAEAIVRANVTFARQPELWRGYEYASSGVRS